MTAMDAAHFRRTLGSFPTGVTVVTSTGPEGEPVGMVCNSFTSVSLDPPLVLICAARSSTTWPLIRERGRFCVNILDSDGEWLGRRFSARSPDRFAGVRWKPSETGPELEDAVARLSCVIDAEHAGGDHVIVVARVLALTDSAAEPLVFHRGRYGALARPPAPAVGRTR
ncbi:flavin reductase family protein [Streptomyces sp. HNA39]|uniref:flavin reductase family protein n=1 Tax=Streptomyces TaxID=1883 RepID=UPI00200E28F0|nr:flavin reductase family protein [Streptomyces sp. HNA39]UQA36861.1 flavin reductase family protein [Streptomyces sp. HNA39]